MKKSFCISFLLFCVIVAMGAPSASYYNADSLNGKNGRELELALKAIVYPHTKISYDNLWNCYPRTDLAPADSVNAVPDSLRVSVNGQTAVHLCYDMYAWMKQFPKYYENRLAHCPSNSNGQDGGLNREHCVPNSWWGAEAGNAIAYTDLHHLVPSDGYANNAKSDYPLGEYLPNANMTMAFPTETKMNTIGYTYCVVDTTANHMGSASHVWNVQSSHFGGASRVFEPTDEYKGDFARMYLYVVCAYEGELSWKTNYMFTSDSQNLTTILPWAKTLLLKWHRQDPVSDKERARNDSVFAIQNNRNPFIDYPNLVEYIWGDSTNVPFDLSATADAYSSDYINNHGGLVNQDPKLYFSQAAYEFYLDKSDYAVSAISTKSQGTITYALAEGDSNCFQIDPQTGSITCTKAGRYIVSATIAANGAFAESTIFATVDILQRYALVGSFNGKYFAMDYKLSAVEVPVLNDAVIGANIDTIGWIIQTTTNANNETITTFRNSQGKYLAAGSSTTLTLASNPYEWSRNENGMWYVKIENTNRSFTYRSPYGFKNYAEINIGRTEDGYASFTVAMPFVDGYVRTITFAENETTKLGTICLDYTVDSSHLSGATFYSIAGYRGSLEAPTSLVLEEETHGICAGKPYIFIASKTLVVAYEGQAQNVQPTMVNGLVGSYDGCNVTAGNYVVAANKIQKCGNNCTIAKNRAYIDMTQVPPFEEDHTTNKLMEYIFSENESMALHFCEANQVQKRIEGNQLIIIRDGIQYNSLGQIIQ